MFTYVGWDACLQNLICWKKAARDRASMVVVRERVRDWAPVNWAPLLFYFERHIPDGNPGENTARTRQPTRPSEWIRIGVREEATLYSSDITLDPTTSVFPPKCYRLISNVVRRPLAFDGGDCAEENR